MHTGRDSARRAAASLLEENEQMHTRSQAPVRRNAPASGATTGASFTSRLNRASGQAVSRSSSSGMGSRPPMRAVATSRQGSWEMRPVRSVARSRVLSWKATSVPSAVTCTSVSRYR